MEKNIHKVYQNIENKRNFLRWLMLYKNKSALKLNKFLESSEYWLRQTFLKNGKKTLSLTATLLEIINVLVNKKKGI